MYSFVEFHAMLLFDQFSISYCCFSLWYTCWTSLNFRYLLYFDLFFSYSLVDGCLIIIALWVEIISFRPFFNEECEKCDFINNVNMKIIIQWTEFGWNHVLKLQPHSASVKKKIRKCMPLPLKYIRVEPVITNVQVFHGYSRVAAAHSWIFWHLHNNQCKTPFLTSAIWLQHMLQRQKSSILRHIKETFQRLSHFFLFNRIRANIQFSLHND